MNIFAKKNKTGGIADVIRCVQEDYLIWKWHPKGAVEGDLNRDTAIRTNSVLRVKDGEVAIPSLIYVFNSKLNTGGRIISSFFVIAEVILNIVFLCIPKADIKIYAIIQLAMIVITLAAFLIIIGLFKDNNAKESN